MKRRWVIAAGLALLDVVLVACGATSDNFGMEGGTDSTLPDASQDTTGPGNEEFFSVDTGSKDTGKQDSETDGGPSDSAIPDTGPAPDVRIVDAALDARQDVVVIDVFHPDASEAGPFCGECEAGTLVDCMCGVHWTCTGGGCWVPHFTCSGTCMPPSMCLLPGAPVDLGVVECATGVEPDGAFLPCCSGSSSAYLCAGHCS